MFSTVKMEESDETQLTIRKKPNLHQFLANLKDLLDNNFSSDKKYNEEFLEYEKLRQKRAVLRQALASTHAKKIELLKEQNLRCDDYMQCENIMNSLRRMIDELKRANTQDDAEKEQVLKDDTAKEQELKDDAAKEQELKDKIEAIKKEISELRNKVQAQPQSPIMTEKDDNGINSEDEDDVEKLREHQSPCSSNMTSTQNNDSNASD